MSESVSFKKNESIQVFRALLFFWVFLHHALMDLEAFNPLDYLHASITPFFVMSGFLLILKDAQDNEPCSFKSCWSSLKKRISRLYPLHIASALFVFFIICARYYHGGALGERIGRKVFELVANVFLVQSWCPLKGFAHSLNGPAWYLSTAAFLYFVFPLVRKIIYKFDKGGGRLLILFAVLLFRIFWAAVVMSVFKKYDWNSDWALYDFPPFRLADFFIGCLAGAFYKENKDKLLFPNFKFSLFQIAIAAFGILFFSIDYSAFPFWIKAFFVSDIARPLLSALWVYFFMDGSGLLRFLRARPLVAIGNISGVCYLIHYPIIEVQQAARNFLDMESSSWSLVQVWSVVVIEFILTIVFSILWIRLVRGIKKREEGER